MNDFSFLKISYYEVNSFEFLVLGYLLLIASLVCIILSRLKFLERFQPFINKYKLSLSSFNYSFLRKQNLEEQTNQIPSLRIFKKK
jgi:hypothetical protein